MSSYVNIDCDNSSTAGPISFRPFQRIQNKYRPMSLVFISSQSFFIILESKSYLQNSTRKMSQWGEESIFLKKSSVIESMKSTMIGDHM